MLLKAEKLGLIRFDLINLRDFGKGLRRQVDDTPYGGGDGMLLMVDPLFRAVQQAKKVDPTAKVILPTPRGETYAQNHANLLAQEATGLILICPRYEGYDERITEWVDYQFSIGKYVVTGGELPAMIIIDSIVRLLPGVLGGEKSTEIESFQTGDTIEFPQYTRPEEYRGLKVPKVLLSGNHQKVEQWRSKQTRHAL